MADVKTQVAIILDRSGSMESIRQEAVDYFNEQLKALKEPPPVEEREGRQVQIDTDDQPDFQTWVSLVTFSDEVDEPVYWQKPLADVEPLTLANYMPNGMTALYDAINDTLTKLEENEDPDTAYLVLVVTDGKENRSARCTDRSELCQHMENLRKKGNWTFGFLGSLEELPEITQEAGLSVGAMYGSAGPTGPQGPAQYRDAVAASANATQSFMEMRTGGGLAVNEYFADSQTHVDEDEEEEED